MDDTSWDGARKLRVREALRGRVEAALASAREAVADQQGAAELDQADVHDVDDLSQSDEGGDLAGLFGGVVARRQEELARVDALDVTPTDVVADGAIVAFGDDHYVVGVAAEAFEVDGTTFEGIAADAPAHAAILGLKAGDRFTIGGTEHRLDLVV
ncbi:hypothetical protein QI633_17315 [Nocardioides sp. QY071]|uniref:hypothetical protein n=1 Tax=Nocardioides sp. QY071 TaxID=3044187 RepID=UPI00249A40BD|nr:hypothetical protein [Nocardioides sp. QY071]WGY00295.1 hypothetical protein QI633_17315 [Nocardioides sp. QY071]